MPSLPVPEGRRSKRIFSTAPRGSLIVNLDRVPKRLPCLILDSSKGGFRLRSSVRLKRGQVVEVILDADPLSAMRCHVVWVGKAGSKLEGEIGLEIVRQ
jgi:PilZ domain-containing protein